MVEKAEVDVCVDADSSSPDLKDDNKVKWSPEEEENLKILVKNFGERNWKTIASLLPGRSEGQCMHRWKNSEDNQPVKGCWSKEEDQKILELASRFGTTRWNLIAQHMTGRLGKQCRERWTNHLDPRLTKASWSHEEDLILYKSHCALGNRWADIAKLLPGRTEGTVKTRWNCFLKGQAELGLLKDDNICVDIQHFVGRVDSKPDAPLDTFTGQMGKSEEPEVRQKTPEQGKLPPPKASRISAPAEEEKEAVDQKKVVDAALRMIAEDMLPLSFVEGAGFRSFMSTISPQYHKLSQRAVALQLYDEVERSIKPQLIRDLKARLSKAQDGAVHVTCDLWAGEEPVVVVRLHFISDSWQIRRPTVAFRHLPGGDVARELEAVLLSYGVFPRSIGYVLLNNAKEALASNSLFCDYKIMCPSNRGRPDNHDILAFLSDCPSRSEAPQSELDFGTGMTCVAETLQQVIGWALKNSRVVENLLSHVHNVVAFFRASDYWTEVLSREHSVSLSSHCRWDSMMVSLRRMVQEAAWNGVMAVLAQARSEASDMASAPPLVMVKREQVLDILALLEPFQGALKALFGNTSSVIPALLRLDKTLEGCSSNYAHFHRCLRAGLCARLQVLMEHQDLIVAAVLDPRTKLKPFCEQLKEPTGFLTPPTKSAARALVEAALRTQADPKRSPEPLQEAAAPETLQATPASCDQDQAGVKRKTPADVLGQPPSKTPRSELDVYLAEPPCSNGSTLLYWKSAARFPHLQCLAKRLLAVPATSGGFDRLCPLAACIVRAKRHRMAPHTTERLLLYKNSFKTHSRGKK
nr:v-myb avian myeloblastosis viral oncogene homolog-like 2a [Nerophis lumbriciformis]XP_061841535.1 v-myb avian myeloblastosis viral oncogene homolog-like 2a [Nerophis lumbriciformis]XP_061841536.1 v-myb avian myeloblastosis viral oncogene homolog-like 2a [Nerophis lumbriciformis]